MARELLNSVAAAKITVALAALAALWGQIGPSTTFAQNGDAPDCFSSWALAHNKNERAATEEGKALGIGSAKLEGPGAVEAYSYQRWTFIYTAGKAGIEPGGGLRIGMRHALRWTPAQTVKADSAGYLTVETPDGVQAEVYSGQAKGLNRFFYQYFPWQNMVEVKVEGRPVRPGETIHVTFGDRSGGSPGMRVQPTDESPFIFKTYVDSQGNGDYLPMARNPCIEIRAAAPYRISVVAPSNAVAGEPTWTLVRVEDRFGNPATSYRGTVRLNAESDHVELPAPHIFTAGDEGVHRFENVVFREPGVHSVSASSDAFRDEGNPTRVTRTEPDESVFWGDLHLHSLFSDGRGTVAQSYDFARRVAGLDFSAMTDHAFQMTEEMWAHSMKVTNAHNAPGQFVTFNAYEWSGMTSVGGDHNVYFLEDHPPFYRSRSYYDYENLQMYHGPQEQVNHVEDLFNVLEKRQTNENVFTVPHYGGRAGNSNFHRPQVQRLIEVFSEHRRSEDWMTKFLANEYELGIIASSDDHHGNPGYGYFKPTGEHDHNWDFDWDEQEIGMALVATYAGELTRASIFDALYNRRTYATSGDRILLSFRVDGHAMGSEYSASEAPTVRVEAYGTAPLRRVEIKKNSEVVHVARPSGRQVDLQWTDTDFHRHHADSDYGHSTYYYVRIVQENDEEAISSPVWVSVE